MTLPTVIEQKGIRVLTSKQIAEKYETSTDIIKKNFSNNRKRYVEGKHYILLTGDELRAFKNQVNNVHLVDRRTSHLYLWTEKGALLHAKSLNTDKAWEVYDYLVDFYFRKRKEEKENQETITVPACTKKVQNLPIVYNPIKCLKILLKVAEDRGIKVDSFPFRSMNSVLKNNHIGIRTEVTVEEACYELARELSHVFIHFDGGDLVESPLSGNYNQQAMRAAEMIIKVLNVKTTGI